MSSENKKLLKMQETDSKLDELQAKLDNLEVRKEVESLKENISDLKERKNQSEKIIEEVLKKMKKTEDELELVSQKLEKEEKKLYGGNITNPKELKGIQEEVASLKKKSDDFETEFLERMEEKDTQKKYFEELEESLAESISKLEKAQKKLSEEEGKLNSEILLVTKKRDEYKEEIEIETIDLYEKLRGEKGGLAVVEMINQMCQGCHVEVPPAQADKVSSGEEYSRCPNCRRILISR